MLNQVQHDDVGVVLTEDLSVPVMPDLIRHPESHGMTPDEIAQPLSPPPILIPQLPLNLPTRLRLAEQKTLPLMAPALAQIGQMLFLLHAFRRDGHPQTPPQADD